MPLTLCENLFIWKLICEHNAPLAVKKRIKSWANIHRWDRGEKWREAHAKIQLKSLIMTLLGSFYKVAVKHPVKLVIWNNAMERNPW